MAVDSVNGGMTYTGYIQSTLLQSTQNTGAIRDTNGDNDKGKIEGSKGGGQNNAFLNSVMQTLNQLGIAPTLQPGAPQAPTSTANTGGENTQSGDNKDNQALPAFMYSLFQAISQNSQGTSPSDTNLTSSLQNILQNLNSNTPDTPDTPDTQEASASQLNSAFQNLVQTLQGGSSSGSLSSLQAFLQTLIQNLSNQPQQGANALGVGNIVDTTG
ncbi:hypothetical protein [Candidatus Magnetominusculus xianensis]|uniref:Uncharacterized protein n=1 Tax=Candidatus Magnetominusculus xianensis TaxID=1748249 RepID=A0ABR5SI67_9BACT|nr:hypothetical protein [Candidatus Magnetominusculus xianensis]KWT92015.1 hypothetical protein ASN18_0623 [Candidatus Magnetominusculus xianensis]MBF0405251.1 hypothetical protein [Nitrospirota bacterium]